MRFFTSNRVDNAEFDNAGFDNVIKIRDGGYAKYFSTEQAAKEFIENNRKQFSIVDEKERIEKAFGDI